MITGSAGDSMISGDFSKLLKFWHRVTKSGYKGYKGFAAGVASRACLYAWGREPGASLGDAHGGRPWVGGVMRWHFASASQRPPPRQQTNGTDYRSTTPPTGAERRPLPIMLEGDGGSPPRSNSTIPFCALSENGARRAGGRKADLCPARIGGGLPPACRAECAAVAKWKEAGLRDLWRSRTMIRRGRALVERSGTGLPGQRGVEPHRRGRNLSEGGNFLARRRGREFCSLCSEVNIRTAIFSAKE